MRKRSTSLNTTTPQGKDDKQNKRTGFILFDDTRPQFLSLAELLIVTILLLILTQTFFFTQIQHIIVNIIVASLVALLGSILIYFAQTEISLRIESQKMARYLRNANKKLLELDKLKSEFIYLATHQIRTPITSIRGYLSTVLEGDYGRVPKKIQDPLNNALISSEEMVNKVEYFLHVTRIERGQVAYDMNPFDLKDLFIHVAEQMKQVCDRTSLSFYVEIDKDENYTVFGAPDKLRQAVTNLIDNAIRYTKKGSVTVRLLRQDKTVRIEVEDTGIGVSKEDERRIFTKFGRAVEAGKFNVFGTGLGLYIAQDIVQAHNGEIGVESKGKGMGSMFYIELPEHRTGNR